MPTPLFTLHEDAAAAAVCLNAGILAAVQAWQKHAAGLPAPAASDGRLAVFTGTLPPPAGTATQPPAAIVAVAFAGFANAKENGILAIQTSNPPLALLVATMARRAMADGGTAAIFRRRLSEN
jgi:hypothetical protein